MKTAPTRKSTLPPGSRVQHEQIVFPTPLDFQTERAQWLAEPWWRRLLGFTARDRRIAAQRKQAKA